MPVSSSYVSGFLFPFLHLYTKQKPLTCFTEGVRRTIYIQTKESRKDAGTMSAWSILLPYKKYILLDVD